MKDFEIEVISLGELDFNVLQKDAIKAFLEILLEMISDLKKQNEEQCGSKE